MRSVVLTRATGRRPSCVVCSLAETQVVLLPFISFSAKVGKKERGSACVVFPFHLVVLLLLTHPLARYPSFLLASSASFCLPLIFTSLVRGGDGNTSCLQKRSFGSSAVGDDGRGPRNGAALSVPHTEEGVVRCLFTPIAIAFIWFPGGRRGHTPSRSVVF